MEAVLKEVKSGFKRTKLGSIPNDWNVGTIGDTLKIENNKRKPISEDERKFIQGVYPYYGPTKVQDYINEYQYEGEYALIAEDGDHFLKYRDYPMTQLVTGKFNVNNHAHVLAGTIDCRTKWFYWFYNRRNIFSHLTRQGAGRYKLNKASLEQLLIAYPESIIEQDEIIKVLDTWDKAISTLTQLIQLKEQKKKALMQQLLTGKKRFPGFEGKWKEYTYKELLKEVKRPVSWNDDELYQLISVRRRSGGLFERDSLYGYQILTKNLNTAHEGDFLISKMQILHGASGLVTEGFDGMKISGSYIAVRSRNENLLDINFLNWYSRMPYFYHQTYISSYGVHIEKMTFDFKSFLKLSMKLPSIEEQAKIVATLESAEKEITILYKKLDTLKDQKKGLMQQLLTGKKRLNYDSLEKSEL